MKETKYYDIHPEMNHTSDPDHPIKIAMLPSGSMHEFQDEAAFFFKQHTNPVVGYTITTPSKLQTILDAFNEVKSAICVVVRDEKDLR
ncbi:hypothetical protein ACTMU2_15515 [Cupriavidus basilensis]